MPPGRPQLAPAGQTYQLPANSLIGDISSRRSDKRKMTVHKRPMGIAVGLKADAIYGAWRDAVKHQMLARGYQTDLHHFLDAEFLQIVAGFRQLRPACDELASASAANDIPGMQKVDEAVVQLVKDCGKKLTNTINLKNKPVSAGAGSSSGAGDRPEHITPCECHPWEPVGSCTSCTECRRWRPKCSHSQCTQASSIQTCPGCWSIPNPSSPAESPRANTTSFASVWKSWSVRKHGTEYASPGDAPSQIAVALVC